MLQGNWNYLLRQVIVTTSFTKTRWIAVSANKMMKERSLRSIKEERGDVGSFLIDLFIVVIISPGEYSKLSGMFERQED